MRVLALAFASMMLFAPGVRADGEPRPPTPIAASSGWTFEVTPYAWLPWLEGEGVIRGREFNVSINPVEILENTDMVWMSYLQAKYGPLTLFSDIIYGDLSSAGSLVTSKQFSPHISGTLGAALTAGYQFWTVEGGAMYEVAQWRTDRDAPYPDTVVELLAGGRYWYQDLSVRVALAGTLNLDGLIVSGNTALARSGGVDWIDPFVGARLRYYPAPGHELWLRGDVGGFGAGSKFTWQAFAAYDLQLCTVGPVVVNGYFAYRALSVDYETGEGVNRYEYDVIEHGPIIGLAGRF